MNYVNAIFLQMEKAYFHFPQQLPLSFFNKQLVTTSLRNFLDDEVPKPE